MPSDDSKPEPKEMDPEQLTRLLELELMQKRVTWKQAGARHRTMRTASFLFLFIVIVATAAAFFLIFSRMNERGPRHEVPTPDAAP
jgi:hypothetical protein